MKPKNMSHKHNCGSQKSHKKTGRGLAGPWLYDYKTGKPIRQASADELQASIEDRFGGGAGVIEADVNGEPRACYVIE